MKGHILIYSSILGTIACMTVGCPFQDGYYYTPYSKITTEEANEIISNFNTKEVVNNLETLFFEHYIHTSTTITTTIYYIDFDEDSSYYYEETTVEYEGNSIYRRKLSNSLVLLDGDQLSIYETDYTTGVGNITQTTLEDPETTFSTYVNNILSYIVCSEMLTKIKEYATSDVSYYTYNNTLEIYADTEYTTDDGLILSGYIDAYFNGNGLLTSYYNCADETVEDEVIYINDYYYASYDVDIPR